MPERVVVVQHGEKERRPGDPGLTPLGHEQAERTARWLVDERSPVAVVSSPLRRALETTAPIAAAAGVAPTTDERLRERMNWSGEGSETLDDFLAEWHRATDDRSFVPRSGDSSHAAADRFLSALRELWAGGPATGEVVVVAHGGVTVDALRTILGDSLLRARCPDLIPHGVPCCAVTELRWSDRWQVELPSTAHLAGSTGHRLPDRS